MFRIVIPLTAILLGSSAHSATSPATENVAKQEPVICKKVVSAESGTKPFDMCMTKAEWAAKKKADAKDPNRMVCRYEQASGSRLKSLKICLTAAEWQNQRQLDRQAIDKLQATTCVRGAGC